MTRRVEVVGKRWGDRAAVTSFDDGQTTEFSVDSYESEHAAGVFTADECDAVAVALIQATPTQSWPATLTERQLDDVAQMSADARVEFALALIRSARP